MCIRRLVFLPVLAVLLCASVGTLSADVWVYVGDFQVYQGAVWTSNPLSVSARQEAAALFGGVYSDYAISIDPSLDPTTITHTAHLDGWGNTQYLGTGFAGEDYFLSTEAGGGYNNSPSFSAYVCDHADCQAYNYSENGPGYGFTAADYTNHVWKLAAVPEPTSWILLATLGGVLFATRRRLGLGRS